MKNKTLEQLEREEKEAWKAWEACDKAWKVCKKAWEEARNTWEKAKNASDEVIIDGWAYEKKEHDFNKKLSEIKIPEGKELWLPSECLRFYENKELREKLNLNNCWFFVKQIRENTDDVAGFVANSGGAYLYCYRGPSYSSASLGVRFKWRVQKTINEEAGT